MDQFSERDLKRLGAVALTGLGLYGVKKVATAVFRKGITWALSSLSYPFTHDTYGENMWELVHSTNRVTPQVVIETALRSEKHGDVIARPLGSRYRYRQLDSLLFDWAQISRMPRPEGLPVDTSVILGPKAKKPLRLEIPIMVSGMAYGLALSAGAKVAMAKATAMTGTATNSGEGVPAPGEIEAAGKYILQISRARWNRKQSLINRADMIEIQLGQGATGGTGHYVKKRDVSPRARRLFGPGKKIQILSTLPEMRNPGELKKVVSWLRDLTDVPIGVKIGAGKFLEEDLARMVEAGVDVVSLDGGEAGTHAAAPILEDDHGLPTFFTLVRAARFLQEQKVKDRVSLVISGGLFTPGDYLKCLALGADAVSIGSVVLFAISHGQLFKTMPWEPPTQLIYSVGYDKKKFNVKKGAQALAYYLQSCSNEMVVSVRALGKSAVTEVNRDDMFSVDPYIAKVAGVAMAHQPQPLMAGQASQSKSQLHQNEQGHLNDLASSGIFPGWKKL